VCVHINATHRDYCTKNLLTLPSCCCCCSIRLPVTEQASQIRYNSCCISVIDRAFDHLNSRNPLAKGYKAPIKLVNQYCWRPFMNEAKSYLWGYRFSQDHIEFLFGAVSGRGGLLPNSSSAQGSYKRLLVHQNFKGTLTPLARKTYNKGLCFLERLTSLICCVLSM